MKTMETSRLLGVSPSTIRRWLRQGRLPEPRRTAAGWRNFVEADVENLRRVLRDLHRTAP